MVFAIHHHCYHWNHLLWFQYGRIVILSFELVLIFKSMDSTIDFRQYEVKYWITLPLIWYLNFYQAWWPGLKSIIEKQILRNKFNILVYFYNKSYNTTIIKSPRWPMTYNEFYSSNLLTIDQSINHYDYQRLLRPESPRSGRLSIGGDRAY